MAQAVTAARMPRAWRDRVILSSAGTAAFGGVGAAPNAVKVLAEEGIDLTRHRSRSLTLGMIEDADLVVAMTQAHRAEILEMAPGAEAKVIVLGELDRGRPDTDIADPIGGDEGAYRRSFEEIERLSALLIDYLAEKFGLSR